MSEREARAMDRRRFVKLAGLGAGAAVAGTAGIARGATPISLTVGVMAPTGATYANMGKSILDGLSLGLDGARTATVPVAATVLQREVERGYGGATSTAEALLDDGADVVVAGVSALVAQRLAPLFAARQRSLVVANVGAHVVGGAQSPLVVHNSLLYWHASYAAGVWAASQGKRAFLAAALGDAGYDTLYAFRRGYESAGGAIVGEAVTHVEPSASGLGAMLAQVQATGANVLYGLYSGQAAADFVQACATARPAARVVVGSLAAEDYLLSALGASASGMYSCSSWTAVRQTALTASFVKSFSSRYGRSPDPFAALGYDTAAFVAEGARRAKLRGIAPARLAEALRGVSIDGPRGKLTVGAGSGVVEGPLWIRQVKRWSTAWANVDVVRAATVTGVPASLTSLAAGDTSGYLNEYLCA